MDKHPIELHGWDCHAHLFGPYSQFPLSEERSYTPPEASEEQYQSLLATLHLSNGVLVHPSAYGEDHSLLFHALANSQNLRGVIVMRADSSFPLDDLYEKGVRGARFSHKSAPGSNFLGSALMSDLLILAPRLADSNIHAELWTDCAAIKELAVDITALPVPVVIDHMGGFDVLKGVNDPGFVALLKLLETGKVWIKLSVYRNLLSIKDWELGLAFQQKMIEVNPDRLVWGSDWPHLRVSSALSTIELLEIFKRWAGNAEIINKILVTNPVHLYQ
jgi:predicted TIM-barrel fold metal-dependent hydrolase